MATGEYKNNGTLVGKQQKSQSVKWNFQDLESYPIHPASLQFTVFDDAWNSKIFFTELQLKHTERQASSSGSRKKRKKIENPTNVISRELIGERDGEEEFI